MSSENISKVRGRLLWLGIMLLAAVIALFVLYYVNGHYVGFNIAEDEEINIEVGEGSLPEIHAFYRGTTFKRNGEEIDYTSEGKADLKKIGTYVIKYHAKHKNKEADATLTVHVVDTKAPVIELVSDPNHFTSPIAEYDEEGFTAIDNYDGDLTEKVERQELEGFVYYKVADSSGNETLVKREILYKDEVAPKLKLKGDKTLEWELGEDFVEPGFKATDDVDGTITDRVVIAGAVDTAVPGTYELTYSVKDSWNNETTKTRKVEVADRTAPKLKLKGDKEIFIKVGSTFEEPGYSAKDDYDGDVTENVEISGMPDLTERGVFEVVYTAYDAAGNKDEKTRTFYVYPDKQPDYSGIPDDKVVYLTFDDGPGPYTQDLLDVLDRYGVKVTFFVTNQYPNYQDMIAKEYDRGHTVAIHSYSHNYSYIYESTDNYFEDLKAMSKICKAQTGVNPKIIRFPGGSSNAISKSYCTGIMTELTAMVQAKGYEYADWNVVSGDAGETTETDQVIANVIEGMQDHSVSVVLQHDIKDFSVAAVEKILVWGLANGYTFLPMETSSPMMHHGVCN